MVKGEPVCHSALNEIHCLVGVHEVIGSLNSVWNIVNSEVTESGLVSVLWPIFGWVFKNDWYRLCYISRHVVPMSYCKSVLSDLL